MNTDEIVRMAIQCQLINTSNRDGIYMDALEAFAKLVEDAAFKRWAAQTKLAVQDEREACLRIQEDWQCVYASDLVQKIRARGEA